jgi:tetratricopeptide (TPR) repeat protein
MYLPLMALVALAVIGGARLREVLRPTDPSPVLWTRRHGALIVVCVALAATTIARNRDYQSALSLAQTTLERWPTAVASHMVGTELSNLNRDEEAIMYLSESAKTHSRARYHLGIALSKTGKLDEAVEQFQMFAREEPLLFEVIAARLYIGQVQMVRERWPDAVNEFRLVLSMNPSHVQARRLLADAVFKQEKYEEASGLYREYLRLRPGDEAALTNLGIALVATEKFDEALAVFRRAVEAEPQSRGAHLNLAEALLDSRDPAGAAVEARQVVALSPDTPEGYDVLGRALALQGQTDAAIAQFERALAIDPGNAAARDHLTRLLKAMGR